MSQGPHQDISSPFSSVRAVPKTPRRPAFTKAALIITVTLSAVLLIGGSLLLFNYLNDPYRKLESFPVSKYFDDFQSLAGLKFRAELRVDADLGWKESIGRLMVFSPSGENRQLVVFIPPALSDVFFNKGQNYTVKLEVKEGGLIYADSCRKD